MIDRAKQRMAGLDALRFAAASMVLLFHLGYMTSVPPTVESISAGVRYPELTTLGFGWVGVQIFFVISGIVISYSAEQSTANGFLRARILRLVPAVWICAPLSALAVASYNLLPGINIGRSLAKSMLFYPWGGWIDDVYWTLGIEIMFYAVVWGLLLCGRIDHLRWLAFAIGGLSAGFLIGTRILVPDFELETAWNRALGLSLLHHGVFFALGILIYQSRDQPMPWLFTAVLTVGGVVQITVAGAKGAEVFHAPPGMAGAIPVSVWLLALLLAYGSVHWSLKGSRRLTLVGLATYPLYLLHQYCGVAFMRWFADHGLNRWVILVVVISIVIGSSFVVVMAERPIRKRLNALFF
jgi:peptidoglycan/LPS O-acetylase OafA/YrhL